MEPDRPSIGMRYLILGCGSIGQRHAANLRLLGVTDILAYDPDESRAVSLAQDCGGRPSLTLAHAYSENPHAALICAPTSVHLSLALSAVSHDCHLFIEKPLSDSLEGIGKLLHEVETRNRVLLVGYNLRFDPLLHELAHWIKEGLIGQVVSARLHFGSYLPLRHPWEDYRQGYGARSALGGGVILDAIHELDYALWLFGHPVRLHCVAGRFSGLELDVEDVAEILLSYPGQVVSIHVDFVEQPFSRTCSIIGTRGQIQCDLVSRRLRMYRADLGSWTAHESSESADDVYVREMEHFLQCLDGTATPLVGGQTAVESLLLAETAKQSAATHQEIAFDMARVQRRIT